MCMATRVNPEFVGRALRCYATRYGMPYGTVGSPTRHGILCPVRRMLKPSSPSTRPSALCARMPAGSARSDNHVLGPAGVAVPTQASAASDVQRCEQRAGVVRAVVTAHRPPGSSGGATFAAAPAKTRQAPRAVLRCIMLDCVATRRTHARQRNVCNPHSPTARVQPTFAAADGATEECSDGSPAGSTVQRCRTSASGGRSGRAPCGTSAGSRGAAPIGAPLDHSGVAYADARSAGGEARRQVGGWVLGRSKQVPDGRGGGKREAAKPAL